MPWLDSIAAAITLSVQWLCSIISAIALAAPTAAASQPAAFVMAADVMTAVKQLSPTSTDDEPLRVIAAGPNRIGVFVVGRPKKTGPAQSRPDGAVQVTEGLQLDQVSAIVRVLDGSGTMVTGGTLIGPQRMAANDPDVDVIGPGQRGKSILGGDSRRLSTGDMVIIPAGVPHGFSEIERPITYLVIRVDAGQVLPLDRDLISQASAAFPAAKQSPFYCDQGALTPTVRKRHFEVLGPRLIAKRMSVRELPDGYEFQLPSDAATYKEAAEFIDAERLCCPFFDISLRATPEGGPLWMRVTGRPGTKQFIAADGADWISRVSLRH
jgi:hypothetical protein